MTFLRVMLKTMVSVKFEFHGETGQPTWTFDWPGSYAPGWEHMQNEVLPVLSVAFTLHQPAQDAPWEVKGTVIECANTDRGGTVLATIHPGDTIPRWLSDLTDRAKRAAEL